MGAPNAPKAIPGPGGEDWGYMDVRTGAHMFYWLYTSTDNPDPTQLPIVIWLQGGPGAGGTGYGNFEEMGPLDVNLQPRNSSWVIITSFSIQIKKSQLLLKILSQ